MPNNYRANAVYLHFLDRELAEAVDLKARGAELVKYVRIMLLMNDSVLYTGLSALWENDHLGVRAALDLEAAFDLNLLRLVSHDMSLVEFQDSRQAAYQHDSARYPRYFGRAAPLTWSAPTIYKASGSTKPLVSDLSAWAGKLVSSPGGSLVTYTAVGAPVLTALQQRDNRAVTFSLFRSHLEGLRNPGVAEQVVRRQISRAFTQDHMHLLAGDLPTGIRGLASFDELAQCFPVHDIPILEEIIAMSGLVAVVDPRNGWGVDAWREVMELRESGPFIDAFSAVPALLAAWGRFERARPLPVGQDQAHYYGIEQIRARIIGILRSAIRYVDRMPPVGEAADPYEVLSRLVAFTHRLPRRIRPREPALADELEAALTPDVSMGPIVLVATVTDTESEALHKALKDAGYLHEQHYGLVNTYWVYRGPAGTVYHVRSSMGSGGQGGSQATIADALKEVPAQAVVAVGIAFGMEESQPIGQVLVSEFVSSYELQRVGQAQGGDPVIVRRGSRQECSPRLVGRFRGARLPDVGINVKIGELLSGEKLIDNSEFKAGLRGAYPEAIGGEMEGAGLQAASGRAGVEWVIVKAVCDYAENKSHDKKARQLAAASAAAGAFVRVLSQGGFRRVEP